MPRLRICGPPVMPVATEDSSGTPASTRSVYVVIAPTTTPSAPAVTPASPARDRSTSAAARVRPCVMSGTTIVPPPTTTPSPSASAAVTPTRSRGAE